MREPVKDLARQEQITPAFSVGVCSLSHRLGAKGTFHLSHSFRGRDSGDLPETLPRKGQSGTWIPFVTDPTAQQCLRRLSPVSGLRDREGPAGAAEDNLALRPSNHDTDRSGQPPVSRGRNEFPFTKNGSHMSCRCYFLQTP